MMWGVIKESGVLGNKVVICLGEYGKGFWNLGPRQLAMLQIFTRQTTEQYCIRKGLIDVQDSLCGPWHRDEKGCLESTADGNHY